MLVVGLMSGTSLDGIDVAIVDILKDSYLLKGFITKPYSNIIKNKILEVSNNQTSNVQKICSLNVELSYLYVDAIKECLNKFSIDLECVDLISMHGQTIWHNPSNLDGYYYSTLQIGDPSVVAYQLNKKVVSNFRTMDMAAGGNGAPLMPYAHYLMFKNELKNIAIQNIGGIGNVTFIEQNGNITAFDTGPGNMLIDGAMKKLFNCEFDENGIVASSGKIITSVLTSLLEDEYLKKDLPKTTGREKYNESFLDKIISDCLKYTKDYKDIITTISAYTAESIVNQYEKFFDKIDKVIVTGGGANNNFIMNYLKSHLKIEVIKSDICDEMEAIGFAMLGYATINNLASNVISATGAKEKVILGNITNAPKIK